MARSLMCTVSLVALVLAVTGPTVAEERRAEAREVRHSGRIVSIAPDRSEIVLEEVVGWTGPGSGVVKRSIQLTPRTSIRLLERTDRWDGDRTSMPGWDVEMMDAASLRPGDFITVSTDDDRHDVAVALQVVRPTGP